MSTWEEELAIAVKDAEGVKDWRSTRAYRIWRVIVIQRDDRCVICNTRKSRHAHHVNHASYFPEQRFDPTNGVCMCGECHIKYHCDFHRSTRVKCTRYDFDNFVSLAEYMFGKKELQLAKVMMPILFGDGKNVDAAAEDILDAVDMIAYEFPIDGSAVMKLRHQK
jgi:hypothetical protein